MLRLSARLNPLYRLACRVRLGFVVGVPWLRALWSHGFSASMIVNMANLFNRLLRLRAGSRPDTLIIGGRVERYIYERLARIPDRRLSSSKRRLKALLMEALQARIAFYEILAYTWRTTRLGSRIGRLCYGSTPIPIPRAIKNNSKTYVNFDIINYDK